MIRTLSICILLSFTVVGGSASVTHIGDVSIRAVSSFGDAITNAVVTVSSAEAPKRVPHSADQNGNVSLRLPYDRYELEISAPGFVSRQVRIGVYQSKIAYRLGLEVASTSESEHATLVGDVLAATKSDALWVRLVPLLGGGLFENDLDERGHFELVDVPAGRRYCSF